MATVESAARNVNETNKACNDGNYISILARSAVVFYLLSWIPILGAFAGWGFLFVMLAIPALILRWWIKYRNILTSDQDYSEVKNLTIMSLAVWIVLIFVWLVGSAVAMFIRAIIWG
jgi:uncharacterized Tic20 family protein